MTEWALPPPEELAEATTDSDPARRLATGLQQMRSADERVQKAGANTVRQFMRRVAAPEQEAATLSLIELAKSTQGGRHFLALMVLSSAWSHVPLGARDEVSGLLLADCMVARAGYWPAAPFKNVQQARRLLSPHQVRTYVLFLVDLFDEADHLTQQRAWRQLPGLADVMSNELRHEVCDRLFEKRGREMAPGGRTPAEGLERVANWIEPTQAERYLRVLMSEGRTGTPLARKTAMMSIGGISQRATPEMKSDVARYLIHVMDNETEPDVALWALLSLGEILDGLPDAELSVALPYLLAGLAAVQRTLYGPSLIRKVEAAFARFPPAARVETVRFWLRELEAGWGPVIDSMWETREGIPWELFEDIERAMEAYLRREDKVSEKEARLLLVFVRERMPPGGVKLRMKRPGE